ncbi:MAG: hypothetical protein HN657_02740 [Candidatus Marinimicrobia bacterium]|jgi:hypothetical protein|nr:hypothetical protein [Candidatus Neomarinimicrobiota bacterium]MBT3497203.1 hypothetical protein [Candidatus Neomarinimicrobiota bacterium]MBT3692079.1 hypothetical protein [Candidatus Neomarinimicrobiota bacterium]MBT3732275.1 hypothetical protein [Candidatus Neomarinimicrobiota bacterium]MBT4143680.1 hypothetical protein [Candidatus Neomarinimicrobiota bacterium]
MWILKVFWVEMILFPIIMLYFVFNSGAWAERTLLQNAAMIMYSLVLIIASGGYFYVWNKSRKK